MLTIWSRSTEEMSLAVAVPGCVGVCPAFAGAFSLGAGQNVLTQFNAAAMEEYAGWRKQQIELMKKYQINNDDPSEFSAHIISER